MNWEVAASVLSQHLQDLHLYLNNARLCHGDVGALWGWEWQWLLEWQGRVWQPVPVLPPQPGAAVGEHWQPQLWASPRGWSQARTWAWEWAWLGGAHGWARIWGVGEWPCCSIFKAGINGHGNLKWGLVLWAERVGEPRDGQGQAGLTGPWGPKFWSQLASFCSSFRELLEQVAAVSCMTLAQKEDL